ncbi:bifunctional aspartate kinase/homoserine dehydrogenase I [Arachidicoccus ginsenosidimutans]|uniref:bifunctional aspartate kinase/homoserine dehydrogenase I n=1 Tax=Arachidicoccus sp. BS20 TaxID=1850526 RepID=UPI0007F07AD7|nr:bifunctional aspartate kinase/homoserine dehydrogenase I [Arachidicoccus sp. BS20]ANI88737.1 bifunctional aspartate kinase/homoserine dehydrogenase I [Arachidicoccus sp. BS20]
MRVLKFGGSSVANAENIKKVKSIISSDNDKKIVVVSAMSGVTNQLLEIGIAASNADESYKNIIQQLLDYHLNEVRHLLPVTNQSACLSLVMQLFNDLEDIAESVFRLQEFSPATKDKILSFGEILSTKIITAYFQSENIAHRLIDVREVIKTNSKFGNAEVNFNITNQLVVDNVKNSKQPILLVPGFIASNKSGQTTTLGRGGSDYTAAIFAAATKADALEIWTDVPGMMTADPRWVSNAKPIAHLSYREAMELSHFGAKVIYPPTIIPAMDANIPIKIKNTFAPYEAGTLIDEGEKREAAEIVTGISSITNIALLSLEGSGMVGVPGISKVLFAALAAAQINVILITQSSSEHSICVAINANDLDKAKETLEEAFRDDILAKRVEPVKEEQQLSIIALVGDKMKSHPGISGKMFSVFGRNGINIRAIAQGSSEKNISAVIAFDDVKKAVNVLHEAFFEKVYKQLNVFIAGTGNVGSRLLAQLNQQKDFLLNNLNLQLRIAGLANSRKMLFSDNGGIHLDNWQNNLQNAQQYDLKNFINEVISRNLRNSVLVDVTADANLAKTYHLLLEKSIFVVACNKVACSSSYDYYKQLKSLSKEFNAQFFFETNVGAGLPVIGTLNDLLRSGDEIVKIQAVLSGTLNFVFNNYDGKTTFAEIVKQAQDAGYTEPDPRLDLGGTDVMRKIMILAREAGNAVSMEDIANTQFLPVSCFEGGVDDFYKELAKHENHFKTLYENAAKKNCKLKYVASFENGKASVGLQEVNEQSDYYHLYGKDNIVLFYTKRYPEQPLVIKGAGAGADVTASGVFADLIKAVS